MFAKNKKAYFDYEIIETYEAGIGLYGSEVKSIRNGGVQLKGSCVIFGQKKTMIQGMHISPYRFSNEDRGSDRLREIFLHKKDIFFLVTKSKEPGYTVIPLQVYPKGRLIKVSIGLVRGRKKYDKRELLKKRDMDRDEEISYKIR